VKAWPRACRFGEESQQPTFPQVRQSLRCTQGEPARRHSAHPSGVCGATGLIISRLRVIRHVHRTLRSASYISGDLGMAYTAVITPSGARQLLPIASSLGALLPTSGPHGGASSGQLVAADLPHYQIGGCAARFGQGSVCEPEQLV